MSLKIEINDNEHANGILQELNSSRKKDGGLHCDFTIIVGSEEISVHKNIISAGSDYFKAMLAHNTVETKSGRVEMKGVDPTCLKQSIEYIYTGRISTTDEYAEALVHVAQLLQLKKLSDGIIDSLEQNLDPKLFFVTKRIAKLFSYKELQVKCEEFAMERFEEISVLDDFNQLEEKEMLRLVKGEGNKASDGIKLKALISWIKFDEKNRRKFLKKLNTYVNLKNVPTTFRRFLVENEPIVKSCLEFSQALLLSVLDNLNVGASDIAVKVDESSAGSGDVDESIVVFDQKSMALQTLNLERKTWKMLQDMPRGSRTNFSAATLGDNIYVFFEDRSVYRLKYTDNVSTWEQVQNMIYDHGRCPSVAVLSGYIYIVGDFTNYSNTVEKFEPTNNEWEKVKDKNLSSHWSEALGAQGCIYSIGGLVHNNCTNKVERFDPTTSTWSFIAPMNEAKCGVAAVEHDGMIYVLGGENNNNQHLSTFEQYNISTNTWTTVVPMLTPRSWFRAFVIGGNIYAVGGWLSGTHSIEKFDFEKNKWEMIDMKEMRILESVKIKSSD